jgi:hypothetical protein
MLLNTFKALEDLTSMLLNTLQALDDLTFMLLNTYKALEVLTSMLLNAFKVLEVLTSILLTPKVPRGQILAFAVSGMLFFLKITLNLVCGLNFNNFQERKIA